MEDINKTDLYELRLDIAMQNRKSQTLITAEKNCLQNAISDAATQVVNLVFIEVAKGKSFFNFFRMASLGVEIYKEVKRITENYKKCKL